MMKREKEPFTVSFDGEIDIADFSLSILNVSFRIKPQRSYHHFSANFISFQTISPPPSKWFQV